MCNPLAQRDKVRLMTRHLALLESSEERSQAAARRLREQIAGRRINVGQVAARLGVSRMWLSRRTNGQTSMTIEDLDAIEAATGISANYLFTGAGSPDVPDGPDEARPERFELPTFWLGAKTGSNVRELHRHSEDLDADAA